jgi:hypothetical protein
MLAHYKCLKELVECCGGFASADDLFLEIRDELIAGREKTGVLRLAV